MSGGKGAGLEFRAILIAVIQEEAAGQDLRAEANGHQFFLRLEQGTSGRVGKAIGPIVTLGIST
jgi:hypothetical protein